MAYLLGQTPFLAAGALVVDCRSRGWATFTFDTTLDLATYTFEFDWNAREQRWYCSIVDVVQRVKVVPYFPVFARAIKGPPGFLYFANISPSERPPDFRELGTRTILVYVPVAILPRVEVEITPAAPAAPLS
jgi:hypothetical protein